ncbi:NlpC/P60 family protein [Gordonia effusa NBRC 100432]|uniref:NlpC/P60 family protein n=1 Tax=Gordonia effusa NBRC 100432 TaxID=1077974 RepID=H0R0M9_9ACTN|nr:C40 family peptidase [Gordonia effusa]GAB18630.1 NlpC/P60 family protein [Gordonia effusa NBRC 100432]
MLTADVLIMPLKIMATALGTGVLPADSPLTRLQSSSTTLDDARSQSESASKKVAAQWKGRGGEAAQNAANATQHKAIVLAGDAKTVVSAIESASAKVKHAADEINSLIDSFGRCAAALGPSLFTIAGLAALLPVAADHVSRGLAVVTRAQSALRVDTATVLKSVRHDAPAATKVGGKTRDMVSCKGIAITLPDGSTAYAPNERAAKAVRAALSQRGVKYSWGGTTTAGFDCSGLTQWAYRQAGLELPRLAQDQDTAGTRVAQSQLLPGDLAVWDGHVAMYIGNNQMVEAGDPVQVSPVRTTNLNQGFQGFYRPR